MKIKTKPKKYNFGFSVICAVCVSREKKKLLSADIYFFCASIPFHDEINGAGWIVYLARIFFKKKTISCPSIDCMQCGVKFFLTPLPIFFLFIIILNLFSPLRVMLAHTDVNQQSHITFRRIFIHGYTFFLSFQPPHFLIFILISIDIFADMPQMMLSCGCECKFFFFNIQRFITIWLLVK